jgi:ABC-2 type transport system ATP-binding protein
MTSFAVKFEAVGKDYKHFHLRDIDFELEEGRIMGFVGPNGAGKSTTIRILLGLIHQDRGNVTVLGHPMPRDQVRAKWDIGFVSEDMRLYPQATLDWHMKLMASIYPKWDEDYAAQLVKRFELRPQQTMKRVSHGERTKAVLLLALARRPRLLVLDEPTTGLDPVARRDVLNEFMDVVTDERRSILFSSHNTLDVEQISDQITFIDKGRIIRSQDKETFLEQWRRLRFAARGGFSAEGLPGIVETVRSGQLGSVITDVYSEDVVERVKQAGADITAVERMTLEEIFVANVVRSRNEVRP